ncbi:short-chain dehydrogenase [Bacillus sp. TL12]|uniref:short-chain dehydrogenase n=1 Tax=Bacillus sp. TL12 TaxID=2894756 RepID=UPI001F519C49|nr:short-chain dehydrogenase [Bacillus sp. TL12]MCI0764280.1 short-chain dehydrogenase [Bacillus sp. TL12]
MHALVIGGTGMLKNVSVWLCNQEFYVSIIGRDKDKLEGVKNTCNAPKIELHSKSYSLFHILGSSASRLERRKIESPLCNYHRVILGFILQGEHSRWLTHEEIAEGVIAGIQSKEDEYIVGTIEPWGLRPIL